jgi:predicted nucleic acid-binding protein
MICIDASVAAKWFFAEEHSAQASGLLRTALEAAEPIIAPPLLPSEVANILRQRMRQGQLDRAAALAVLARFLAIPITLRVPESLYDRALVLADEYNLPAVYDAHYVALAELLGATLWTADQRLLRILAGRLSFVHDVGDWQQTE